MPGDARTQPVYLGSGSRATFGLFHAPVGGEPSPPVLFCPPFGFDEVCSHATRRRWAEHLAAAGHPVLRVDLPGTGDSGGDPRDPDLVETWIAALDDAATWLARRCAVADVAAVAIGLGGLLALAAAERGAPLTAVALWGAPATGRRAVRELRASARMERASLDPDEVPEGAVHSGGFLMMPATASALGALDAATLGRPGLRLLLLGCDDTAVDDGLCGALRSAGAQVAVAPGPGYDDMMAEPRTDKPAPEAVFDTVDAWLSDVAVAAAAVREDGSRPTLDGLTVRGTALRESPLSIEQPFGRLLAILSEPEERPADRAAGLCLVLLNAGAQRRIGPNRLYVDLARRCAAAGVPAVRVDLAGIGDSDLDGLPSHDVEGFYAEPVGDQIRATLDALEHGGHGTRFALAGLCSGGFWAVEMCLADERVGCALMLNPGIVALDRMRDLAWNARRIGRLRQPGSWLRLLRGEVPRDEIVRALRVVGRAPRTLLAHLAARLRARTRSAVPADPTAAVFDRLRDGGKRALLLLGAEERLRDDLAHYGLLDEFHRWPDIDLRLLEGTVQTHELQPLRLQRQALEIVDEVLAREVGAGRPGR